MDREIAKVWPEWIVEKKIDSGTYGVVYKAVRREHGIESQAAIKVLSVPISSSQVDSLLSEGLDMNATKTSLKNLVNEFIGEIQTMISLKGARNIVCIEDFKVVEKKDEIGWHIFIRMELLTPLNKYLCDKVLDEAEVMQIGKDMCTALEICGERGIVHRDIKPENMFIDGFGQFKLGDFGISRKLSGLSANLSSRGTPYYMAPEVCSEGACNARVDIYSLGVVLYRLMNRNRLPFFDDNKQILSNEERMEKINRRLRGEIFPPPCDASPEMADLILRACAFAPEDRFASATEMKQALESVLNGTYIIGTDRLNGTKRVRPVVANLNGTKAVRKAPASGTSKGTSSVINTFGNNSNNIFDSVKATASALKERVLDSFSNSNNGVMKKVIVASVAAIIVTAIILIAIAVSNHSSIEQRILRELEAGNYESVIEIYNEDYSDKHADDLTEVLIDRIEKLKEDFASGEINYETVIKEIDTIETIGRSLVYDELSELENYAENINNSRIAFESAETLLDQGDYVNAIVQYQAVSDQDSNYDIAKKQLEKASEAYRESVFLKADEYATAGDYENAVAAIEEGLTVLPDDAELTAKLNEYNTVIIDARSRTTALTTAEEQASNGDLKGAITTIKSAMTGNNSDNQELLGAYNSYCESYENEVVKKVDALLKKRSYTEAVQTISEAIEFLPDSERLISKRNDVESKKPLPLSMVTMFDADEGLHGWNWNEGDPTDSFGVTHNDVCNFKISNWPDSYVEYKLSGEYAYITGSVVPYKGILNEEYGQIKIYADGILVYTSPKIVKKTEMFDFCVDISGAEYVKIELSINYYSSWNDCFILMETQLWKE